MKFIVAETIHYTVEADNALGAIESRKAGEGIAIAEQTSWRAMSVGRPVSILPAEWPMWAKALSQFATPDDKGIGDVVARTIGAENSEAFRKWYKATTGKDCGCTGRQRRWNIEYPLNLKAI